MKIILLVTTLLFSSFFLLSCKKDSPIPPEDQPQISLTLEDVSCTEAWIKLTTANVSLPADVELLKDDNPVKTISLISADTILYIDSLLPNHSYKFQSIIQSFNHSSNLLTVTTMDTTSHDFTWQSWTFGGQAGSCTLYDVAIINENDIWAVGRINIADTSLNGYTTYNAVHWDGSQWELKRLRYYGNCSAVEFPPLRAIWAFSANDIVVTNGGSIGWFDGNTVTLDCEMHPLLTGAINKIWGSSDNDLYIVGNNGTIAHYDGQNWSKIESGTDMSLVDMVGTSGNNIFISGSDANNVKGIILKKYNSGWETFVNSRIVTPQELFNPDLFGSLPAIWLDAKNTLYAAGNLLYWYKSGRWDYVHSLPENFIGGNPGAYYRGYIGDVKGLKSNDMWIAGDRNTLRHFNGVSWQQIGFPYSPESDIAWYTVYPTETCVAVVGYAGNSAIVMLIKR